MHSLGKLTDKRNHVQHRLASVPAYPYAKCSGTYQLYESTRLAARMYSLLSVFPSHVSTAPFRQIAALLRIELLHRDPGIFSYGESKLLLWILVLGAIITVGTVDRQWFINALRPLSRRLKLDSWHDMKSILIRGTRERTDNVLGFPR